MNRRILFPIAAACLLTGGCNRRPAVIMETSPRPYAPTSIAHIETLETQTLRTELATFERTPTAVQGALVKKIIAEIDLELAQLNELLATKTEEERANVADKVAELRACRDAAQARFLRLETPVPLQPAEQPANEGPAEKAGAKIDEAARKVRGKLLEAADAVREQTR